MEKGQEGGMWNEEGGVIMVVVMEVLVVESEWPLRATIGEA